MPLLEQGGSAPKISNLHQFRAAGKGPLTIKESKAQMKEMKRLAFLEAEKKKYKKRAVGEGMRMSSRTTFNFSTGVHQRSEQQKHMTFAPPEHLLELLQL
nr:hypothetical protein [Tanacetum cinerariifolium]